MTNDTIAKILDSDDAVYRAMPEPTPTDADLRRMAAEDIARERELFAEFVADEPDSLMDFEAWLDDRHTPDYV